MLLAFSQVVWGQSSSAVYAEQRSAGFPCQLYRACTVGNFAPESLHYTAGTSLLIAHIVAQSSANTRCTNEIAIEPSPTAEATRFTLPARTSPTANTPGKLVSSI
jgi:hypothetical protein